MRTQARQAVRRLRLRGLGRSSRPAAMQCTSQTCTELIQERNAMQTPVSTDEDAQHSTMSSAASRRRALSRKREHMLGRLGESVSPVGIL